jgi:SAM-dependent methyltransferase
MDTALYVQTWAEERGADMSRRNPIEIPNTNRVTLAHLFSVLGFGVGVELGVERAVYSEVLCQENPGVRLYCVDAWRAYRGYRDHVSQQKLDRFYVEASERMAKFQRATLVRKFSAEAVQDFEDGSLDFVYIDAAHDLVSVVSDIARWSRKVRPGGIVAGHDYLKAPLPSLMHVPQAIHAWTDAYQIPRWYVLGRKDKVEGELRDDGRSWFYVVPQPVPRRGVIKQ